jgi:hypothetical protein
MVLIGRELPEGTPLSSSTLRLNSALPVVLPEPLYCESELRIEILQSPKFGLFGTYQKDQMALFD